MALLLSASLKAAGGAALLPLTYDSVLAAAVTMVLPGVAAGLELGAAEALHLPTPAVNGVRLRTAEGIRAG